MIEQLKESLSKHESTLGFNPLEVNQTDFNWHRMKLGVVSASNCHEIFKPSRGAGLTRKTYMNELIGEVCTGLPVEEISAKALDWGKEHEPRAKELYNLLEFGGVIQDIPFVYGSKLMRHGCSPDGIDGDIGVEVKCPFTTKVHIDFLRDGTIKKEYHDQMQFSMMVSKCNAWKFVSFDPRMTRRNLEVVTVERNDSRISEIHDAMCEFIHEMDAALKLIGFKFGDQWEVANNFEVRKAPKQNLEDF